MGSSETLRTPIVAAAELGRTVRERAVGFARGRAAGAPAATSSSFSLGATPEGQASGVPLPDATTMHRWPDGTTAYEQPNGTRSTRWPDGTTAERMADGTTITRWPDGTILYERPNGTQLAGWPDGTTAERGPAGLVVSGWPDGTRMVADAGVGDRVGAQAPR